MADPAILRASNFDRYVANLQMLRAQGLIKLSLSNGSMSLDDIILCPLCRLFFHRSCLDNPVQIDLEHLPPQSLGGKDRDAILLCRKCNNTTGSKLDSQAAEYLKFKDDITLPQGLAVDAKLILGTDKSTNMHLVIAEDGALGIHFQEERNDPKLLEQIKAHLDSLVGIDSANIEFTIKIVGPHEWRAKVAWLKYAFLKMFQEFGYYPLLHAPYNLLRQQILNPEQEIIPAEWDVSHLVHNMPPSGIYAIVTPNDMQSHLVVYEVENHKSIVEKKAIVLPTLTDINCDIYSSFKDTRGKNFQYVAVSGRYSYWNDIAACHSVLKMLFQRPPDIS